MLNGPRQHMQHAPHRIDGKWLLLPAKTESQDDLSWTRASAFHTNEVFAYSASERTSASVGARIDHPDLQAQSKFRSDSRGLIARYCDPLIIARHYPYVPLLERYHRED